MELRHLASFVAVVRHGGFTRAADTLHLAQPAVSAHVRRLETELGTTLLARTTRSVRLTRAGELLLRRADQVLHDLDAARDEIDQLAGVVRGRVRIGAIQALGPLDLPALLARFVALYPGVTLSLTSGPTDRLVADLAENRIDLGLGPVPAPLPGHLIAETLFSDELVVVTAPDHRLAGRGPLDLADLAEDPFVCLPPDSGLRALLDSAAARAGTRVAVPFECTNLDRMRALVAHGLGVALVARSVAESPGPLVSVHAVAPTPLHRAVGLLQHGRGLDAAGRACADVLRRGARHHPGVG